MDDDQTDADGWNEQPFIERLADLAHDWRCSDALIGIVVRRHLAREEKVPLHDFVAKEHPSDGCSICDEGMVYYLHGGAVCSIGYCEANGTEFVGANPWPFCPEHAYEHEADRAPLPARGSEQ